ncbi:MAG: rRNA maturation RNase YbeY [Bacteroidia bacterium]|nr:rRNA maturation RNase YbeY [Bacteroidia bacterium]MDW8235363.1 rRNA maturation RNase YbeY [Bacteroidia bacterium]
MRKTALLPQIRCYYTPETRRWRLRPASQYRQWIQICIERLCLRRLQKIGYFFIPTSHMSALHEEFLQDSSATDVMTFDYGDALEIFIAPAYVALLCKEYGETFAEGIRRTMVHGLLHAAGRRDDTPAHEAAMRNEENFYLNLWKEMFHVKHVGRAV